MIRHALVFLTVTLFVAGGVSGQPQRSPATLDDLLAEVRALRAEINQSTAVSTRALLLAARVQVQEHRISEANRLLVELQREADFVTRRREDLTEGLKVLEERRPTLIPAQRAENEENIRRSMERLQEETQRESALRQRLTDASNTLFLEQNRWAEFTSRLDELERALSLSR